MWQPETHSNNKISTNCAVFFFLVDAVLKNKDQRFPRQALTPLRVSFLNGSTDTPDTPWVSTGHLIFNSVEANSACEYKVAAELHEA